MVCLVTALVASVVVFVPIAVRNAAPAVAFSSDPLPTGTWNRDWYNDHSAGSGPITDTDTQASTADGGLPGISQDTTNPNHGGMSQAYFIAHRVVTLTQKERYAFAIDSRASLFVDWVAATSPVDISAGNHTIQYVLQFDSNWQNGLQPGSPLVYTPQSVALDTVLAPQLATGTWARDWSQGGSVVYSDTLASSPDGGLPLEWHNPGSNNPSPGGLTWVPIPTQINGGQPWGWHAQRSITLPTAGTFGVDALTDNQTTISIDGVLTAGVGLWRAQTSLTIQAGTHTIAMDYSEDGQGEAGDYLTIMPSTTAVNGPGTSEMLGASNPSEKSCSCNSTHNPVNNATGNFFHSFTDLAIAGRGLALNLQRTYNSLSAAQNGPFGYGWTSSYGSKLTFDQNSNATVIQENGSTVGFAFARGVYTPPTRVFASLTHNQDGTFTFQRADQSQLQFSSTGRLVRETDRNQYSTQFAYPTGQEVITDPAGRTVTLTFSGSQVSAASDSTGRTVGYLYDGSGNLQQVTDANGGLTRFTYYPDHTLHTMTDPNGGVVTNVYDVSGRVTSQTDALQRITTFDYTVPGQTKITDPRGYQVLEVYGFNHLLTARTLGYGISEAATWNYTYDPLTLGVTSITDPNNHVVHNTWDSNGNVLTHANGGSATTTYTYDSLNDVLTVQDPLGVTTTDVYDAAGNLKSSSTPLVGTGQTATVTYQYTDASHPGDVTGMVDANGKLWQYGYDQFGDKNQTIDPLGAKTTQTFNADGWPLTQVSPNGYAIGPVASYTTTYDYTDQRLGVGHVNGFGDVGVTTDPLGRKTAVTYDANRNVTFVKDANQHTTQTIFDLDNEVAEVDRADGTKVKTQYDPNGNVTSQIDGLNNATSYYYDSRNHLTLAANSDRLERYAYDAVGNLMTFTNRQGQHTYYGYDAADQKTTIYYSDGITPNVSQIDYDPDGQRLDMTYGTLTTTYQYDSLHRLTQQTNGAMSTVAYGYDLGGHVTSITYPGQAKPVLRTYDDAGRLKTVTDWLGTSGNTTTYGYDANSNLTSQAYPNGTNATFTPDAANQIGTIVDKQGGNTFLNLAYTRDGLGQLKAEGVTGYNYNSIDQLTTAGPSSYGYDAANNLTKRADGHTQTYDAANVLQKDLTPISLVGTASAGDSGTTSSVTVPLPAGVQANDQILVATTGNSSIVVTTPVGYTAVGTVTSGGTTRDKTSVYRKTAAGTETSVTVPYSAASAKSIVVAIYRGVDAATPVDVKSSGSAAGGKTVVAPSVSSTLAPEKLVFIAGAAGYATTSSWTAPAGMTDRVHKSDVIKTAAALSDQTLVAPGASGTRTATFGLSANLTGYMLALRPAATNFSYDLLGNRTGVTTPSGQTTTQAYDQANRMTAFGTTATYTYDGDGLRTGKNVSGVAEPYTYDLSKGLPLIIQDGATSYVTGAGGLPLEQITGSTVLYYHQDQLGSSRVLTNQAGTVVGTASYDPYGNVAANTGVASPFTYAGQYRDSESGLVYLRARYYDPSTGQFISRDPAVAKTRQPYSYVADNPLNGVDPSGEACLAFWDTSQCDNPLTQFISTVTGHYPDYSTLQLGFGPVVGGQVGVTYSKSGHIFFDVGANVGTPGLALAGGPGWIKQNQSASPCQTDDFIKGWTVAGGGTFLVGGNYVWGNPPGQQSSDYGYEVLGGTPQGGGSVTYSWQLPWSGPITWR